MSGRFIAVVGPSGVGKDSVMRAMADRRAGLSLVRRCITRPSDAGGEDFDGMTEAEFTRMQTAGKFALSWPAHGLFYGIPATVDARLAAGEDLLANLSRAVLHDAVARFPRVDIVNLTAAPEVLVARLSARGREPQAEIEKRLARAEFSLPQGLPVTHIANEGPLDQTVSQALAQLYPENG